MIDPSRIVAERETALGVPMVKTNTPSAANGTAAR